jgi:hypothetical protein
MDKLPSRTIEPVVSVFLEWDTHVQRQPHWDHGYVGFVHNDNILNLFGNWKMG